MTLKSRAGLNFIEGSEGGSEQHRRNGVLAACSWAECRGET